MNMKRMKYSLKFTSIATAFLLCTFLYFGENDSESIPAFVQTDGTTDANDVIEAYQTVDSPDMEAYVNDVEAVNKQ